jgi:hypothetical protein
MKAPTCRPHSYCEAITDERLAELLPDIPSNVNVAFFGHVRTRQTGYGTWRIIVELEINGATIQLGFSNNDEEFIQKLRGHDEFSAEEQADALDTAVVMAMDQNDADVCEALAQASAAAFMEASATRIN